MTCITSNKSLQRDMLSSFTSFIICRKNFCQLRKFWWKPELKIKHAPDCLKQVRSSAHLCNTALAITKSNVLKLHEWSKSTISVSESNIGNQNYTLRNEHIIIPAHTLIAFVSLIKRHYSVRYYLTGQ